MTEVFAAADSTGYHSGGRRCDRCMTEVFAAADNTGYHSRGPRGCSAVGRKGLARRNICDRAGGGNRSLDVAWLPSSMLQACYMLVHLSHLIRNLVQLLVPSIEKTVHSFLLFIKPFFKKSIYICQRGFTRPELFLLGNGAIALRDSLALLPWHFRETLVLRTLVY